MSRTASISTLVFVVVAPLVACGLADAASSSTTFPSPTPSSTPGSSSLDPADVSIRVRYHDSSMAPQYHRSYVLTASGGRVHVVVDAYGEVLHDVVVDMPDDEWRSFVAGLSEDLQGLPEAEATDEACTGGSALDLRVTSADVDFERSPNNCNSSANLELTEAIRQAMAPAYDSVDLDALTATD